MQAHSAPTASMAVDASGGLIATASTAHELRVWDVSGGFCTHSFTGHRGIILAVLFHSRELLLASAGDDGTVILWDLVAKKKRATLCGHVSAVPALAWSQDEWTLLSAGRDKVVNVWDIRSHTKLRTVAVFDSLEALAVLPPGMSVPGTAGRKVPAQSLFFAAAGESGAVKVWDARTGNSMYEQPSRKGGSHARGVVDVLLRSRAPPRRRHVRLLH